MAPKKTVRYVNATEAALELDRVVTPQRILYLCKNKRIVGAKLIGRVWSIPLPVRIRTGKKGGRPRRTRTTEASNTRGIGSP